jgi:hypothetical protein
MPDSRTHRGPHPADLEDFKDTRLPALQDAVEDLSWLLTRDYARPSALELVGNRYQLTARQRNAVSRAACSDAERSERWLKQITAKNGPSELNLDGFNVLVTLEAALGGGVLIRCRDDCLRDLASVHGTYRKVDETVAALELAGAYLHVREVKRACWYLDQPVSNSGRLADIIRGLARERGWPWEVELVPDPDPLLAASPIPVASSDSHILNHVAAWYNLAAHVVGSACSDAWIVDL